MKKIIPLIFAIILTNTCFSQHYSKYTNHWYFLQNAGLDFSNFSPVADTNGAINFSYNSGYSSVMSDYYGNLLFYSDGYHVYNKNHQQMPNGFGLKGGFFQSGVVRVGVPNIIFPKPGDSTLYYHFVPVQNTDTIAYYSIISLSADTGKGDVILKNIPFMSSSTIKMGVVKHSNGECYWLILHKRFSNAFHAYSFCGNTIDSIVPVISNVGQIYSNYERSKGIISISPDGKKLAVTSYILNYFIDTIRLELFDFNAATGVVGNQLIIPRGYYDDYSSIAFSPDSKKLYAANYYGGNSVIYQFNLDAGSDSAIINSKTIIEYPASGRYFCGMQLGLDGKIYIYRRYNSIANNQYLGVINNPNTLGIACNYVENGIFLGTSHYCHGLPMLVASFLLPPIEFNFTNVCLGDSVNFTLLDSVSSVSWDFGDSSSGNANYSNLAAPKHFYSTAGIYTVTAKCLHYGMHDTTTQIINIYPLPTVNLGQDTIVDSTTVLVLDAGAGFTSYQWSTGDSTQTITINGSGLSVGTFQYFVEVTDTNGCIDSDTILVITGTPGIEELIQNRNVCISPNPTTGVIKISLYGIKKDFKLSIQNILGQKIIKPQLISNNQTNLQFDLSSQPKGIYFIKLANKDFVKVEKVVVQ